MNGILTALTVLVGLVFLVMVFGPRETVNWEIYVAPTDIGDDIAAYLAKVEAREEGITPGTEKRVVWAGAPGQKTPISVVYLHGFSATQMEMAPAPERLAKALGANLFLTRLTGHGQSPEALGRAQANDWLNDAAEAVEIGDRLGEAVILISASTGGTLSIAMAALPGYAQMIDGLILVSPNLEVNQPGIGLMTKPFARVYVPWIAGSEVTWEPSNAEHGTFWTTRYPLDVVFQMVALVAEVRGIEHQDIGTPALFVYSDEDSVVKASATREVVAAWGGPVEEWKVVPGEGIDDGNHVIVGDILSPGMTDPFVERAAAWVRATLEK